MAFSLFAGGGPLANLEIRDRILAVTQSRTIEEMMAKVGARSFQDLARFNDPNYFNAFFVDRKYLPFRSQGWGADSPFIGQQEYVGYRQAGYPEWDMAPDFLNLFISRANTLNTLRHLGYPQPDGTYPFYELQHLREIGELLNPTYSGPDDPNRMYGGFGQLPLGEGSVAP